MSKEIVIDGNYEEFVEDVTDTDDNTTLVSSCGREVLTTADLSDDDLVKIKESESEEAPKPLDLDLLTEPKPKMTKREIIDAINAAAANGLIDSRQKSDLKDNLNIQKSLYTNKQESKLSKSKKRKQQKTSRKKNRK